MKLTFLKFVVKKRDRLGQSDQGVIAVPSQWPPQHRYVSAIQTKGPGLHLKPTFLFEAPFLPIKFLERLQPLVKPICSLIVRNFSVAQYLVTRVQLHVYGKDKNSCRQIQTRETGFFVEPFAAFCRAISRNNFCFCCSVSILST